MILMYGIFFYLVLSPIAIILRFFRLDLLDKDIQKLDKTYWKELP